MATTGRRKRLVVLTGMVAVLSIPMLAAGRAVVTPTGIDPVIECPTDLELAVADSHFSGNYSVWDGEFLVNSAEPSNPWTLSQFEATTRPPRTGQPAGLPPPSLWARMSYGGEENMGATGEFAVTIGQTLIPMSGPIEAIQFTFDTWGGLGPAVSVVIRQDSAYYRGPSVGSGQEWRSFDTGCLTADQFTLVLGDGPDRPDFARRMRFGLSAAYTTNRSGINVDFLIDNFRVYADGEFVTDYEALEGVPNRPPVANPDRRTLREEDPLSFTTAYYDVTGNDYDPDRRDRLRIAAVSDGFFGSVEIGGQDGAEVTYRQTSSLPDGRDQFEYVVSDGELSDTTTVDIVMSRACIFDEANAKRGNVDLDLIRRFRDVVMAPTPDGARFIEHYYSAAVGLLGLLVIDRRDLGARAVSVAELLQPYLVDILDGNGDLTFEQSVADSLDGLLADIQEAGSRSVRILVRNERTRIGPFTDLAGQPVGDILERVLGAPVNTGSEEARPDELESAIEAYPNPFGGSVDLHFDLQQAGPVLIEVFDIHGRRVGRLADKLFSAGPHRLSWDGSDESGVRLASGVYIAQIRTGAQTRTATIVLQR